MRIRLLIDCEGPNPAFDPPDPKRDMAAWMTYKATVPHTITISAGTEIEDPWAWVHCVPDEEGVIRAEPIDDQARLMVESELKTLSAKQKARYERFWARRRELAPAEPVAG